MATKGELVNLAFTELVISGITKQPSPEEITIAIRQMDRMVAQWRNKHLCLGYNNTVNGEDTNQDSGLSLEQESAVYLNLSTRLCPIFGISPHLQTMADAKEAYSNLFPTDLVMRENTPYLPMGAGGGGYQDGYCHDFEFQRYEINAESGCETIDLVVGEIGYFTIDFTDYLSKVEGQEIQTHSIESAQDVVGADVERVKILSSSVIDSNKAVKLKVEAKAKGAAVTVVKITTTGTDQRVLPRKVQFNIE
jgi:hypothetical protein